MIGFFELGSFFFCAREKQLDVSGAKDERSRHTGRVV